MSGQIGVSCGQTPEPLARANFLVRAYFQQRQRQGPNLRTRLRSLRRLASPRRRQVGALPPRLVELQRSWVAEHGLGNDDLLFRTRNDRRPAPSNWSRALKRALATVGHPPLWVYEAVAEMSVARLGGGEAAEEEPGGRGPDAVAISNPSVTVGFPPDRGGFGDAQVPGAPDRRRR